MSKLRFLQSVSLISLLFVAGSPGALAAGSIVVMSGLDQPRGLALAPNGDLYVAEAGTGGSQPCFDTGPTGATFYGRTGAVSRLRKGVQERIVSGLPSAIDNNGFALAGPVDVLVAGDSSVQVAMGLANEPHVRAECEPVGAIFGTLLQLASNGHQRVIADLAAHEAATNPDGGVVESNPCGLLKGPSQTFVADSAGNTLLEVGSNGRVKTRAVFPSRSTGRAVDAVPTSVARGPDGAYYVGELTGIPYPAGEARVYRVVPGAEPTVFLTGFTAIIDIAFGPDGSLYVLQFASGAGLSGAGALIRVAPDGTRTTVASEGLIAPSSVAIAQDGTIYLSNCGVFPGGGDAPCHGHVISLDT